MPFRVLADLVVLIHLGFIVFVMLGSTLAGHWRWLPWVHLPAVLWGALLEFFGWTCPLTPLENRLRRAAGAAEYAGGFVEQYVVPIVYPAALPLETHVALGIFVCVINVGLYRPTFTRFVEVRRFVAR